MYKIVVVDDEMWTRIGIIKQIDWDGLPLSLAGEASDGEEGYDLVGRVNADILLTDVKMPVIDGLTLSKMLLDKYPSLKIIVVSGFSEYELVRQALVSKTMDYILKPVDKTELNNVLKNAIEEIEAEQSRKTEEFNRQALLERSLPSFRGKCLHKILNKNSLSQVEMDELCRIIGVEFVKNGFTIAVTHRSNPHNVGSTYIEDIVRKAQERTDPATLRFTGRISVFESLDNPEEHIVVAEIKETKDYTAFIRLLFSTGELINARIGIGKHYVGLETLPVSYGEAIFALRRARAHGLYGVSLYDDYKKKRLIHDEIEKICMYVKGNYHLPLTLEGIADMYFFNRSYLSREFKTYTGESFIDYLTRIRLENAVDLLLKTDLSILEISQTVGFQNANYFSRIFKKMMKYPPTEYKNSTFAQKSSCSKALNLVE